MRLIEKIREKVEAGQFEFSKHAVDQSIIRRISMRWIRLTETPASIRVDAPVRGEHTNQVLGELLGLPATSLRGLRGQKAIK